MSGQNSCWEVQSGGRTRRPTRQVVAQVSTELSCKIKLLVVLARTRSGNKAQNYLQL